MPSLHLVGIKISRGRRPHRLIVVRIGPSILLIGRESCLLEVLNHVLVEVLVSVASLGECSSLLLQNRHV